MTNPDALDAVSPDVAARTRALLEAVASGGSAGLKSYEQSQQAMTLSKTDAITRAQQRAALIGGPEAQGFEGQASSQYDRGISNLGTARTGFESHMATLGAAHKNYLDQVNSAVPLVRADTQRQLALKQQALDAAAAKDAAEKAEKGPDITLDALLGFASQAANLPAKPLRHGGTMEERNAIATQEINRQLAAYDPAKLTDLAAEAGTLLGVPETKLAGLYAPSKQSSLLNANQNLTPQTQDVVAKALATKYDTKGVTYDLAKSVINNTDYQAFVAWIQGGALDDDGNPLNRAEVQDSIYQKFIAQDGRNWAAEYNVLVGEWLPLIPTKVA